jgi:predicted nucleic acid-binding protein
MCVPPTKSELAFLDVCTEIAWTGFRQRLEESEMQANLTQREKKFLLNKKIQRFSLFITLLDGAWEVAKNVT